ncbi:phosphatidylethanolamine-binding protein [Crucibulum laeve]|uniref:Phosphatidylethanolamine-binding protein n=1 Tax=Crucibulum laeve TaxID=68775 RepID=A0A5C3MG95_9AGAR|nr:phosphatidylethanolamine-binding protein [Crucibulum laeve]
MLSFTAVIFSVALFKPVYAQTLQSSLSNVTQAFMQAQIVPDVLSSFNPTDAAGITFLDSSTMQAVNVTPGALLSMEQTAMEPQLSLLSNSTSQMSNQTFVLALVDPDAPTPQNTSLSQFLHFLGGDFTVGTTSGNSSLLTNSSAALMEFFPPTPPAGSDPHRYVLVVFNQPSDFDTMASTFVNSSTPRNNFNLTTFAGEVGLGNPVAGNYFLVGPDNSSTSATASSQPMPNTSGSVVTSTSSGSTTTPAAGTGANGDYLGKQALSLRASKILGVLIVVTQLVHLY